MVGQQIRLKGKNLTENEHMKLEGQFTLPHHLLDTPNLCLQGSRFG